MSKPHIEIPYQYLGLVPDRNKFASIRSSSFHTFHYAEPKEDLLDIRIWNGATPAGELAASFHETQSRQSYLIFPMEYAAVRAQFNPYEVFHGPKLVFTSGERAALAYALGLLEKGSLYGIWADLHNT